MIKGMLVIIPCGAGKIWGRTPGYGPCKAKEAYTGALFKISREYARSVCRKVDDPEREVRLHRIRICHS